MESLSVKELLGLLQSHEQRVARMNDDSALEQALQSKLSNTEERYKQRGGHYNEKGDKTKIFIKEVLEIQNMIA